MRSLTSRFSSWEFLKSGKEKENIPYYWHSLAPTPSTSGVVSWDCEVEHKKDQHNNSSLTETSANLYFMNSKQEQELKPTILVPLSAVLSNP